MSTPNQASGSPTEQDALTLVQERLQPLMVAVMVTAFMTGPMTLLKLIDPDRPWPTLTMIVFLVALEGTLTTLWLRRAPLSLRRTPFRLAEIVTLASLLRVGLWLLEGSFPTPDLWRDYLLNPFLVLDLRYVVYLLMAGLAWQQATHYGRLFLALRPDAAETAYFQMSDREREETGASPTVLINREAVTRGFVSSWIMGGAILVIFAAATTVDPASLSRPEGSAFSLRDINRLGLHPDMLLGLLTYFITGFWLASQGALAVLRARWLSDRAEIDPRLVANWSRLSLILLLLVFLAAAFLPIGSTLAIGRVVQALFGLVTLLVGLFVALLSLIVYALRFLLSGGAPVDEAVPPPADLFPQAEQFFAGPQNQTPSIIVGALFWIVALAAAALAMVYFLRQRGVQLSLGPLAGLWPVFVRFVASWWKRVAHGAAEARSAVTAAIRRVETPNSVNAAKWRFLRLSTLSQREQIRYFYLSTARRASERGVGRKAGQTPLEYAGSLRDSWPEASSDVVDLTEAFLQARYSQESFEDQDVGPIRRTWQRIRSALKKSVRSAG